MSENEILRLMEQLVKMAATGEYFSEDPYNKERYHAIRECAETLYSKINGFDKVMLEPYDKVGYVTPKVGVNAIIENAKGEMLLEKRMDDKCWGIPGGWSEVGYTAEENVIREMSEETGLEVKVIEILDVVYRKPSEKYIHTSYHILFRCEIISGTLTKSHESEEVAWKNPDEISVWHFDHKEWIDRVKQKIK
jgi:ADP-ribose pyrophosphatase YjhB (NUDIX family)